MLYFIVFLNGLVLGAIAAYTWLKKSEPPDTVMSEQDREVLKLARQWENFLNYNGSEEGQRTLED